MKDGAVMMYLGGFAPVGGIEAFARDFLVEIGGAYDRRELLYWGRSIGEIPLLREISQSGTRISRSPFRWFCRWNLPDYCLWLLKKNRIKQAAIVFFKKPPPSPIIKALRAIRSVDGNPPKFVLITPYRPSEYWSTPSKAESLKYFDAIIVQSEEWKTELRCLQYEGKITTIPLIPPHPSQTISFPSSGFPDIIKIGYLGRLEKAKNLIYLLDVFDQVQQQTAVQLELHLFGGGSQRQELKKFIADRHLSSIVIHGKIPKDHINSAIDSCDLFVNASLTEGQCLVALEVLSRGRPLVATPVGALPELLSDRRLGCLAPLDDPQGFSTAILKVTNEIQSGRMIPDEIQRAFLKRYDRGLICSRYIEFIDQMLSIPE